MHLNMLSRAGLRLAPLLLGTAAIAAPAMASAQDAVDPDVIAKMLAGESQTEGDELAALIAEAEAYPLGSAENPVRAHMPPGQRNYLSRLRCADLKAPKFQRRGSAGLSPYGNIVDVYEVSCEGGTPAPGLIYIDMYHAGHVETRAVEGYGIVGGTAD